MQGFFDIVMKILETIYAFKYILLIILMLYFFRYLPFIIKYYKSSYRRESGVNIFKFLFNTGYFGEGMTFIELEKIPICSRILTNLYIPTEDGTTEIDLVYITNSGIYVIESKNYSGWIYGSYKSREWTQNIYGKKYKFLNPIWQNKKHIEYLSKIIPNIEIKSLIVFSERCTLKNVNAYDTLVFKRNELKNRILKDVHVNVLTNEKINEIYNILKQYGNRSNKEKKEHIERIRDKR